MLKIITMLEVFNVPKMADFYDNEYDKFQHSEMSKTGSVVLRLI